MRIFAAYTPGKNNVFNLHLLDEVDASLRSHSSRADFLCWISKERGGVSVLAIVTQAAYMYSRPHRKKVTYVAIPP